MVRGPVPKRSDQRRRRNKPEADAPAVVVAMGQQVVKPPAEDRAWHSSIRKATGRKPA